MHEITIKFNNLDRAKLYLKSKGYRYSESYNHKEDRCYLYRRGKSWIKLTSTYDYFDVDTMDMGTVWTVEQF
jgi:hypothetical protein